MLRLFAGLSAGLLLSPLSAAQLDESTRIEVPGQVIVSFTTDDSTFDLEETVAQWALESVDASVRVAASKSLLQWQRRGELRTTNVVLIDYTPLTMQSSTLLPLLRGISGFQWATPNFGFTDDVRELIPNDPQYGSQYHHPLMQNNDAWDITLGDSSVIVGITDDGVDLDHEDLAANIWSNTGEIAGDGIDNDSNGYIDDVNGWDFLSDNNDANPEGADDHGTHVSGITAAKTNNGVGVAGVAGDATIMPLQWYASGQAWTASNVAEAFAYGADNGARIISTSYNMDIFADDLTVKAAFDYLYDQGVLHFNSAGNGGAANPARQVFHQSLLVVSTDINDLKSSFSNYGTGVDVSAPGSNVLSSILNDAYGLKSGTSMAAPNAAGVAALIWSANPTWTRDQVAAQLCFTADDIDGSNPGLEGLLGSGRINAFQALTANLPAPRVSSIAGLPAEGGSLVGDLGTIQLRFDQIMDPATSNAAGAFSLTHAGADGAFGSADDIDIAITWDEYLIGGNEINISPQLLTASGLYRLVAHAAVLANPFGGALDGNADGVGGDSWSRTFIACATIVVLEDNAESGIGWSVVNEGLSTGAWTQDPEVPTGGGLRNDPPTDFDGSGKCFLTQNGAGDTDVDGGPTRLISKAWDLTGEADPHMSFARWLVTSGDDVMTVDISGNDGASWTQVDVLQGGSDWEVESFRVLDHVALSAQTRLRFSVADTGSGSITEAGIDRIRILLTDCGGPNIGTNYCVGAPNSVGAGGSIRVTGSRVVALNDVMLIAESLPTGQTGLFYFGPNSIQTAFGNGFRCAGGYTVRLAPTIVSDAIGRVERALDLTAAPAATWIMAGTTTNFQCWYRDPAAGGAAFNLTNGVTVIWE
ncbi:MAG: subtilisin family serine protease [Planctomycetota bacterium]|jgi:subtilisin family serine protease